MGVYNVNKLSNNDYFHLRQFYQGNCVERCVDVCSPRYDRYHSTINNWPTPSQKILKNLKVRGLVGDSVKTHLGTLYLHFEITEQGRRIFEEYSNAHSK